MSEETPTIELTDDTADSTPPDGHPPGSNGESQKMLPQDEVNAIVARRVAKAERATEQRLTAEFDDRLAEAKREAKPKPATKPAGNSTTAQEALSAVDELRKDLAFERLINGRTLTDEQKKQARAVDNEESQKAMIEAFDAVAKQAATDSTPEGDAGENGNLYVSQGSASTQPADQLELDATKWSAELIQQKIANGTFSADREEYRNSLAGAGNRLWSKRPIAKPK